MIERVRITSELREQILVTQNWNDPPNRREHYDELAQKAKEERFLSQPPAILQPMPDFYHGYFRYHVYNGNTRYRVSGEYGCELDGLLVSDDSEIPKSEKLRFRPHDLLGLLHRGLCSSLCYNGPSLEELEKYSLEALIQELEKQENLGLVHNGMLDYKGPAEEARVLKGGFRESRDYWNL